MGVRAARVISSLGGSREMLASMVFHRAKSLVGSRISQMEKLKEPYNPSELRGNVLNGLGIENVEDVSKGIEGNTEDVDIIRQIAMRFLGSTKVPMMLGDSLTTREGNWFDKRTKLSWEQGTEKLLYYPDFSRRLLGKIYGEWIALLGIIPPSNDVESLMINKNIDWLTMLYFSERLERRQDRPSGAKYPNPGSMQVSLSFLICKPGESPELNSRQILASGKVAF